MDKVVHDWNWQGAYASLQRALALEPGSATTMWKAGILYANVGSYEKALMLDRKAVELDPLNTQAYLNLGNTAYYHGQQDEAAKAIEKALEINPELPPAHAYLGRVYLMQARWQDAWNIMGKETNAGWRLIGLALANHALGKRQEADANLAFLIEKYKEIDAFQIAEIYAYRGDADRALEWLEKAYAQRDGGLCQVKNDPLLKNLEQDSRYRRFMKRMNLDGSSASILGSDVAADR